MHQSSTWTGAKHVQSQRDALENKPQFVLVSTEFVTHLVSNQLRNIKFERRDRTRGVKIN